MNRYLFSYSGRFLYQTIHTLKKHKYIVEAHAPHREEDSGKRYEGKLIHSNIDMRILEILYLLMIARYQFL
jgi:hypothetical protein